MKKIILYSFTAIFMAVALSSCLFVNDPVGSEFTDGTIKGESTVHLGKADSINFRKQTTEAGFDFALAEMNKVQLLGQLITAQFSLCGGKDGNPPGAHAYQFKFSLETDNYAGYLCLPQNFGGQMVSTYYNSESFNGGVLGSFMYVKNYLVPILNHPQIDSIPEIKSLALLIYNAAAQEAVDAYGPFPYADYKANKQGHPFVYNQTDTIYSTIVTNIDTIVACFQHYANRPAWYKTKVNALLSQYDKLSPFGGNKMENWVRYANSLKLRLAMNAAKVNPTLAREWAESAVQSGVIEMPSQQFSIAPKVIGFQHPLVEISNSWNDTRLNASFETILKQYKHPVLSFLFTKNSHQIINENNNAKICAADSMYVGLRSGIRMLPGQSFDANFRAAYSKVSDAIQDMPLFIMKLSEVQFLRAEGALRGWNMGGTAESFYNNGIENAYADTELALMNESTGWEPVDFESNYYKANLSEYMNIETAKNIKYVDPANEENDIQSLVKVGVKWSNSDNNETKLEKIITQKYIAGFPYSFTAWTDLRRTGYPRIFPVLNDDGDGSILPGDIIRRIPFTDTDQEAVRNDIMSTGLKALGGPDKQGTRIWWDVDAPNF